MTLTLWFRNCDPGEEPYCGLFLISAGDGDTDNSTACWSVWVQDNGLYFDNNPTYFYLLDFMADRHKITHKAWRHLAFVWDAADDSISVYLDGELGAKRPWGSKVSEMDCALRSGASRKFVTLGRSLPFSTWVWGAGEGCCVNGFFCLKSCLCTYRNNLRRGRNI
jgi:hypothetical protein